MMKKTIPLIIALLLFTFSPPALAGTKTFIKEYTYQASEYDSKINCRTLAFQQVQRLLLEELGTYIESHTEVKNFQLTKDQITALTGGIVKTSILAEKWDGQRYWMQAKIEADPDDVTKKVDGLRKDNQKTKELEELRKRSEDLLKENERLRIELTVAKGEKRGQKIAEYDENIKYLTANEWFKKGYSFGVSGNHNGAIDAFSKGIELNPKDAGAYSNRGVAYALLGNHKQAIQDYNRAIELNPKDAGAYYNRGLAYGWLSNYKQAIQDYNRAIELNPKYAGAYYNRGLAYGNLSNYKQAIQDFNKAIGLNPKDAFSYYNRGLTYGNLSNYKQAIQDFNKAIGLNPNLIEAYKSRGIAYTILGNRKKAENDNKIATKLEKQKTPYDHLNLKEIIEEANAQLNVGNHQKAVEAFTKAIEKSPKLVFLYNGRSIAYGKLHDHEKSINDLSKVIELEPNNIGAYEFRAGNYRMMYNYEKAIEDYNKVVELAPNKADIYYERGFAYNQIGEQQKALNDFKTAARLGDKRAQDYLKLEKKVQTPLNTNGRKLTSVDWFNKGIEFKKSRDYEEAIEAFTKAIELNPKYTQAYLHRSEAYKKLNKYSWNADQDINKASELDAKATWEWITQEGFH